MSQAELTEQTKTQTVIQAMAAVGRQPSITENDIIVSHPCLLHEWNGAVIPAKSLCFHPPANANLWQMLFPEVHYYDKSSDRVFTSQSVIFSFDLPYLWRAEAREDFLKSIPGHALASEPTAAPRTAQSDQSLRGKATDGLAKPGF